MSVLKSGIKIRKRGGKKGQNDEKNGKPRDMYEKTNATKNKMNDGKSSNSENTYKKTNINNGYKEVNKSENIEDRKSIIKRNKRTETGKNENNYAGYEFSKSELLSYLAIGYIGSFLLLYLFFSSILFSTVCGVAGAIIFIKYMRKIKAEKRRQKFASEFKDAMDSMVAALSAGYSMENAVYEAEKDLLLLYGEERDITRELKSMRLKLGYGKQLDVLFAELGKRSGVEDIVVFSEVYATARKSGGNLVKIMKRTSDAIGEKIDIEREVGTMIAGKKMEAYCMMVIPLLIIVYLRVFSSGFLDPLYSGLMGRAFMAVALVVYVITTLWSRKIMDIKY